MAGPYLCLHIASDDSIHTSQCATTHRQKRYLGLRRKTFYYPKPNPNVLNETARSETQSTHSSAVRCMYMYVQEQIALYLYIVHSALGTPLALGSTRSSLLINGAKMKS